MDFVIVPGPAGTATPYLFADVAGLANAQLASGPFAYASRLEKLAFRMYESKKLNSIVRLPGRDRLFQRLKPVVQTDGGPRSSTPSVAYLILNLAVPYLRPETLADAREAGSPLVLLFFDPLSNPSSKEAFRRRNEFDLVLSFDSQDATTMACQSFFQVFSDSLIPAERSISSDVFFLGRDKGRRELLVNCARRFEEEHLVHDISLFRSRGLRAVAGVRNRWLYEPYPRMLERAARANCLLEIMQGTQVGATARYVEAVAMGRKLLTNNSAIASYPFYNSNYMKIFTTPDEIDVEWVRRREPVDYGYSGQFSPVDLIRRIDSLLGG
jgi:hypothetical protein